MPESHDIIIIINGIKKLRGNSTDGDLFTLEQYVVSANAALAEAEDETTIEQIHEALDAVEAWVTSTLAECDTHSNILKAFL